MGKETRQENDNPSEAELDVSSLETHFVEQDDDSQTLWEVEEILAEKGNYYKVQWVGFDPKTGERWEPSWVPKSDCTDPLVLAWKKKKAQMKKPGRKSAAGQGRKSSETSKRNTGSSSSRTRSATLVSKHNDAKPSSVAFAGSKRKRVERSVSLESRASGPEHPKKKRKVSVEVSTNLKSNLNSERISDKHVMQHVDDHKRNGKGKEKETDDESLVNPNRRLKRRQKLFLGSDEETVPQRKPIAKLSESNRYVSPEISNANPSTTPPPSQKTNRPRTTHSVSNDEVPEEIIEKSRQSPFKMKQRPQSSVRTDNSRYPKPKSSPHISSQWPPRPISPSNSISSNPVQSPVPSRNVSRDSSVSASYYDIIPHAADVSQTYQNSSKSGEDTNTNHAYSNDVVPETEAEASGESQTQQNGGSLSIVRTPSKASKVARMKPRTPGSKRNVLNPDLIEVPVVAETTNSQRGQSSSPQREPLHPIPYFSPSQFAPHLPSTNNNQPTSIIESEEKNDDNHDSIEQFESPDKSKSKPQISQEIVESNSIERPSSPATDVMAKGIFMSEAFKRSKAPQENGVIMTKTSLNIIIEREKKKTPQIIEESLETNHVDGNLEAFADSFVDYDGGVAVEQENLLKTDRANISSVLAPFESEGEVVRDRQETLIPSGNDMSMSSANREAEPDPTANMSLQRFNDDYVTANSSLEVQPKSSGTIPESQPVPSQNHKQPILLLPPEQKRSPPHSPPRCEDMEIPPTLSPQRRASDAVLPSQTQSSIDTLEAAMTLLNKRSEEIVRLETLLATAQAEIMQLVGGSVNPNNLSNDNQNSDLAHEQRLKTLTDAWDAEKFTLTTDLEIVRKRYAQAEKDIEFFREQYLRASAFVSEVQEENKQLIQRAEVAETQATTGLKGIHAMYEQRVKQLEEEVKYNKRVATFLIECSQRTQDEEIRRKAAEYPEMERKCVESEEMLEHARELIDTFEKQVAERDKNVGILQNENGRLQEEIAKLKEELHTVRESNKADTVSGECQVYRCLWRRDGKNSCDAMFFSKEDLLRHVELAEHA